MGTAADTGIGTETGGDAPTAEAFAASARPPTPTGPGGATKPGPPPASEPGTPAASDAAPPPGGRDRILREARALFTRHGFASVSMQQIADAAGVNKATLYHHYRDKEALFLAVVERERDRVAAEIDAAVAAAGSLRDRLLRVAERLVAVEQGDIGRMTVDLRQHVAPERRHDLLQGPPPWDGLRRAVAEAVAAGEARLVDPELAARLFFVAVMSEVGRLRGGDAAPIDAPAIVAVLCDGIAAR